MRAVVQRVSSASVKVDGETISQISRGLMVLVGIGTDDTDTDMAMIAKKILSLRVFSDPSDPEKMWKASVQDIGGDILCVSQFTLMANTSKGNKPDFHRAMGSDASREMYSRFLQKLGESYSNEKIKGTPLFHVTNPCITADNFLDGKFGAMMDVNLTNEGPVTFTLDSRKFEYVDTPSTSRSKSASQTPARKPSPPRESS